MLVYVRIKQQASMTAFATQLSQITEALGGPGGGAAPKAKERERAVAPASPAPHLPKLQTGLKVGWGQQHAPSLMPRAARLLASQTTAPAGGLGFSQLPPSGCILPPPLLPRQVTITVVGIDVLFRVQSRDLMSVKLEQGRVAVDQRVVTRMSGEGAGAGVLAHAQRAVE